MLRRSSSANGAVEIVPKGGLGNQLFIWAAGLAVARRHESRLVADVTAIRPDPQRVLELQTFNSGIASFLTTSTPARRLIPRRTRTIVEADFRYDPHVAAAPRSARLEGYFQSWRYFADILPEVTERCLTMSTPTRWFSETAEELRTGQSGMVVVHMRFGDYEKPEVARLHGRTSPAYFSRAIEHVFAEGHRGRLVVFSDDAAQAAAKLGRDDAEYLTPPPESPPIESIALMALGSAHIISNSTFGWWGATLARQHQGATVVAPDPWFGELQHDTTDLLWPDWVTLARD